MRRKYKKTFNPNRIKINISYSVPEIARLLGTHKGTVLLWHKKEGLKTIDDRPPYLFHGSEVRRFIRERQAKRKHKCAPNEFFCFKCRKAMTSANNQVFVIIRNRKQLVVQGYCSVCNSPVNRRNAVKNLPEIEQIFRIEEIHNKHLLEYLPPIATIDLKGEADNERNTLGAEQNEPRE